MTHGQSDVAPELQRSLRAMAPNRRVLARLIEGGGETVLPGPPRSRARSAWGEREREEGLGREEGGCPEASAGGLRRTTRVSVRGAGVSVRGAMLRARRRPTAAAVRAPSWPPSSAGCSSPPVRSGDRARVL